MTGVQTCALPICHGRRYYLTGDLTRVDAEGNFYFVGLVQDAIVGEAYAIGETEIEAAIASHAAVAEVAVFDKPDKLHGEIVKALVILKPGHEPTPALAREIALIAKAKLAAADYLPEVEFVTSLPARAKGQPPSRSPS